MATDIESTAVHAPETPSRNKNVSSSSSYSGPIDTEKLGRSRPDIFANGWVEIGFCISVLGSMMMAEFLISGFSVLLPVLIEDTGIDPNQRTWPITVFSLVTGSLLLPFGRLVDMFGGYPVYLGGLSWLTLWAIVGGFSRTLPMVLATRALQGVGAAAFLPAGTTLLGTTYRPGPRKNTIFSLYGGCAPLGFFSGIIVAGLTGEFLYWGWFFWIAIQTVLRVPPLLAALWFSPMAAGGIIIALVGGVTLHRLPGTILLLLAGTGFVLCSLLFALIPENPSYWRWVFPAMVCTTIGIDISFNVSGIFITTSVPKHQQGLAGACINGLVFLGISFFLGWADFAVMSRSSNGLGESYKVAFWFAVGCGAGVILIVLGFIRIGKAKSDFTVDEKAQQRQTVHENEEARPETVAMT
ncbi:hypothetical protein Daesc_004034 [Daldinia eschscholtzii]|uniref:Major facilitator superfamily (MFS) profile domain-containing protein n=1 Tax=Daldinia eschscholtzii TaxID=292717 RepID=A0AAX6MPG5_9PEZI